MEILYATDGLPPATAAGELLRRLADPSRVNVAILFVQELGGEAMDDSVAIGLEEAESAFRGAGIATRVLRMKGDAVISIEKVLADQGSGLVVLGAGNHDWLGRLAFGSVSTHMLHSAPVPLLLVHRTPDPTHERLHVLFGADGSPSAESAMDTLAAMTEPDRIDLEVRTAVHTPELGFSAHPGAFVPTRFIEDLFAAEEATAKKHLGETLDRARVMGFTAHGSLGVGWPANDLLSHGEKKEADLIVVGARGLGTLARMTMGSVSAHVARHAPAALVSHAWGYPVETEEIEEPDGDVSSNRYAVRWG
ncbi:MAG TPA: universal stress protein [Actinomycetota bacterium]